MRKDEDIKCIASRGKEPGLTNERKEAAGLTPGERGKVRREMEKIAEMRETANKSI